MMSSHSNAPIIAHMERFLGPIIDGWKQDGDGSDLAFPLARFALPGVPGWSVIATLGLSAYALKQGNDSGIRQELLVCWPDEALDESVPSHLYAVGKTVMGVGEPVPMGALLNLPPEPLLAAGEGKRFAAWYATVPFFLPESAVICQETDPPTVLCWLVPIHAEEAYWIDEQGDEAFEQLILAGEKSTYFQWPRPSFLIQANPR